MVEHIKVYLENTLRPGPCTTEQPNIYPSVEIGLDMERELSTLSKAVEQKQNAILALIRDKP